ncbi:hypothetical protein NI26_04455 [Curtobacterium sp. MR_MD2014]|nr:hypothetical protein NI26_04455 [Curtobacterium sp. MR_MD2014]
MHRRPRPQPAPRPQPPDPRQHPAARGRSRLPDPRWQAQTVAGTAETVRSIVHCPSTRVPT